ncbi:MAG: type II toxin-antitoxin system PemK/MazF family toxin [Bacteroidota bacterium]
MSIQRGEVYEVYPDPSIGREIQKKRPCVVVSDNVFNASSPLAVVVPLTDATGKSPDVLHVEVLRKEGGISKDSIALCDQLKAVDQTRIDQKLGNISLDTMAKITLGIKRVLAL